MNEPSPVDPSCWHQLHAPNPGVSWLKQLRGSVHSIINFGCWGSSEPFSLLWTLNASEITVAEIKASYLDEPKEEWTRLKQLCPRCTKGREVEFIAADLLTAQLESNRFDLVYCEDVLYQIRIERQWQGVQAAVTKMAEVVEPEGWIVAVEEKITGRRDDLRTKGPDDISWIFESAGLCRESLDFAPDWSYCHRKPVIASKASSKKANQSSE